MLYIKMIQTNRKIINWIWNESQKIHLWDELNFTSKLYLNIKFTGDIRKYRIQFENRPEKLSIPLIELLTKTYALETFDYLLISTLYLIINLVCINCVLELPDSPVNCPNLHLHLLHLLGLRVLHFVFGTFTSSKLAPFDASA